MRLVTAKADVWEVLPAAAIAAHSIMCGHSEKAAVHPSNTGCMPGMPTPTGMSAIAEAGAARGDILGLQWAVLQACQRFRTARRVVPTTADGVIDVARQFTPDVAPPPADIESKIRTAMLCSHLKIGGSDVRAQ